MEVDAATVGEALRELERTQPRLSGWLLDDRGELREHVNIFADGERVSLDRALSGGDEIFVVQAISGG